MQIVLQKLRLIFFHVLFPLSIGIFIYLFFRSKSLIIFRWIDIFEISNKFESLRIYLSQYKSNLPVWLIYSVPDALWVYSLISAIFITWGKDFLNVKFWLVISLLIAPSLEFLQFLKLFPGTFDIIDLLFYLIGSILSLTIVKHNLKKNEKQNF